MDITSFRCNQTLAKAEYEFNVFNDSATIPFIGVEDIQTGGAIDRIIQFLKVLIHNVKKIVVAIYNFFRDRFRRDLSMRSQVESYVNTVSKLYKKLSPEKKNAIDSALANTSVGATWSKENQDKMQNNFKKVCMYTHSTILSNIDKNIENIFSEPDWFKDTDELSIVGIGISQSGHVTSTQVVHDSERETLGSIGYTNIEKVIETYRSYAEMFPDYKETQKLSLKLMDLERKLAQQMDNVKHDSLIETDVKQYTKAVSESVNDGITFVKSLTDVLMSMFVNITRRYMIVLSTSYKLLTTSK